MKKLGDSENLEGEEENDGSDLLKKIKFDSHSLQLDENIRMR
jgi:hypothetical protein